MRILITGISGVHARLVTEKLYNAGHQVCGIDTRPWPDAPPGIEIAACDIRKRKATDFFRKHRPEVVIHMGTMTYFDAPQQTRYRINLEGTRAVFEHCHEFGVRQAVFVGRHTIYGAAADAPLYRNEDEPPLAASTFPELSDLVAADLLAGASLWRWPELTTCVLRICYALGPSCRGTLASFLVGPRVPMVLGFDPLFQFMHDDDCARAIVAAVDHDLRGVFNVAGPAPVPLGTLIRGTGRQALALPESLVRRSLGHFGLPKLPQGAIPHLKHPIIVDPSAFQHATHFEARFDEHEVMQSFRDSRVP